MEKIWLKHYPAGVPADIDANKYQSIRDLFEESAASFGERPAYHCMGKEITFADLDRMSQAFGAWLQSRGPAKRRSRGADDAQRACNTRWQLFGVLRAGLVVVNVNPLYTPRELRAPAARIRGARRS